MYTVAPGYSATSHQHANKIQLLCNIECRIHSLEMLLVQADLVWKPVDTSEDLWRQLKLMGIPKDMYNVAPSYTIFQSPNHMV